MTGMNAYTFVPWSEDGTSSALRVSLARLSKERPCVGSAGSLLFLASQHALSMPGLHQPARPQSFVTNVTELRN